PSVLGSGVAYLIEGHIMKAVTEPFDIVPILSEVEPGDGVLILKGHPEPQNLRVEADCSIQVGNVQIDMGNIKRPDHLPSSSSSFATAHRQREAERRTNPYLALHPNLATVQLHELPTQGEPQPSALHLLRRRPDLPELLKHRLLVLLGDADP